MSHISEGRRPDQTVLPMELVEHLERLSKLKESGALSDVEFAQAKEQLLAKSSGAASSSPSRSSASDGGSRAAAAGGRAGGSGGGGAGSAVATEEETHDSVRQVRAQLPVLAASLSAAISLRA